MFKLEDKNNRFRGCLLGLAVGDAVGTTVEFKNRGTFPPVTDMAGKGPFNLKPGQWTDDTSMALCLATSLVESGGFDPVDQMNRYLQWYKNGYLSSTGKCFDIGNTTRIALDRFQQTNDPFSGLNDPHSAGNGSLMRLAPVALYYFPDREKVIHFSVESSRTTHGAQECLDTCRLFGDVLFRALGGSGKKEILTGPPLDEIVSVSIKAIAEGSYFEKSEKDIAGTGYVVKSLEAALWCFWKSNSFEEAILKAANLGDDADTTAAICGQVAGAYYGESGIPRKWLEKLYMREEIGRLAEKIVGTFS
jgi:ADP-ribosyl-[dinitrogen reductase] hydrolase